MNATEQIALLRRACEISLDCTGLLKSPELKAKWDIPDGTTIYDFCCLALREALSATATPPEDDVAVLRGVFDKIDAACKETGCPGGLAYAVWIRRLAKERDEAHKELADIYAAKPEPQFRAITSTIVEKRGWVEFAKCATWDDAKRIADALNAGGKP